MLHTEIWSNDGYFCALAGVVKIEDFHQINQNVHDNSHSDAINFIVIDLSDALRFRLSDDQLIEISASGFCADLSSRPLRVALMSRSKSHSDFILRFMTYTKAAETGWVYKNFSDIRSALEWCVGQEETQLAQYQDIGGPGYHLKRKHGLRTKLERWLIQHK